MSDYDIDYDCPCPKCENEFTHSRTCTNWCDDGYMDEADNDAINFAPGESIHPCPECRGTSIERWCPKCGENLSGHHWPDDELEQRFDPRQTYLMFGEGSL